MTISPFEIVVTAAEDIAVPCFSNLADVAPDNHLTTFEATSHHDSRIMPLFSFVEEGSAPSVAKPIGAGTPPNMNRPTLAARPCVRPSLAIRQWFP